MIGLATRERPAALPTLQTENDRQEEGLDHTVPAADPPASDQPQPYWDTHPETD